MRDATEGLRRIKKSGEGFAPVEESLGKWEALREDFPRVWHRRAELGARRLTRLKVGIRGRLRVQEGEGWFKRLSEGYG